VGGLESREQAEELVERLAKLVNDTWTRREKIEPDTTTNQRLQALELGQWLP